MIKVILTKDEIKIIGHSDYEEVGKDIVCSAVSSILITTVNAIYKLNLDSIKYERYEDKFDEDKDYSIIKIKKNDDITTKLLENMIDLIKDLACKYPKDIQVKER